MERAGWPADPTSFSPWRCFPACSSPDSASAPGLSRRKANAGHVSLDQLKVMSAIERKLNKSLLEGARGDDPDSGSVGNSANRNDACRSERAE